MHSLKVNYLNSLSFSSEQAATLRAIGEFQGKQALYTEQTPQILESLKQVAVIESSESSNRLEGITAPHDRIEALVLQKTTPKNRSEQELAGYRDALALIHESGEHMEFTNNIILQLHSMIYRYLPNPGGKWKATDNEIVERNPDGTVKRVRFTPTPAHLTPKQMDELVARYKEITNPPDKDPLIILPLAILDFLCIHPFTDGNGRMARLLTLMLLYHFDYEVGRYISLERVFEQSKETYYETLEASSKHWHEGKHNVMPWLNYFWGVLIKAYREFEERVGTIQTGRGSKTSQIKQSINRKIGPFAISDLESDCPGISRDMIRNVLRSLRDDGAIKAQGRGRSAKWIKLKDTV